MLDTNYTMHSIYRMYLFVFKLHAQLFPAMQMTYRCENTVVIRFLSTV